MNRLMQFVGNQTDKLTADRGRPAFTVSYFIRDSINLNELILNYSKQDKSQNGLV